MLASDVDNPEFMNAQRPDDALWVEFYMQDPIVHQATSTTREQRLGKRVPYVRIARPGDQTTVIEAAVRDSHKIRFPKQWMAFQIREGMATGPDSLGWKIEEWPELKDQETQIHELKYRRFDTVEQIAGASDAQIQPLGMSGVGLREKAKQAIKDRRRAEFKGEMDAKDKEISAMQERLAKLEAMLPGAMPQVKHESNTLHMPKKG